jgi:membrane protein implicated in regulation of membrane protease activity
VKKADLKLYVDFLLIVFYVAAIITGVLRSFKLISCYWHTGMVVYTTLLIGVHLFLNWRQFLGAIDRKLQGR